MRPRRLLPGVALGLLAPLSAAAQTVPPTLADLLREATPEERDTIENVAKRLYPASRTAINDVIDDIKDEEKAKVGETKFVRGWTGDISLGASWSSGNTNEWSVTASVDLKRKGPRWEHDLSADVDVTDSEGERTEERYGGNYRGRRDFTRSPWFAFGSFAYEHDRPQDIDRRFTEAIGIGYQFYDSDEFKWEASGGPALRQTRFIDAPSENRVAAFLGTELKWEITDTLTFREKAQAVLDGGNTSFSSSSSITSNLYGRLSGKLSFDLDAESNPPSGNKKVDKRTRVSLVLSL